MAMQNDQLKVIMNDGFSKIQDNLKTIGDEQKEGFAMVAKGPSKHLEEVK